MIKVEFESVQAGLFEHNGFAYGCDWPNGQLHLYCLTCEKSWMCESRDTALNTMRTHAIFRDYAHSLKFSSMVP